MFFFFTNLPHSNFYTAYFYANLMLRLNPVRALTEMKLNLLHWIFFRQVIRSCKLISFRLCEFSAHFLYRLFQIHPNSILSTEISKDTF